MKRYRLIENLLNKIFTVSILKTIMKSVIIFTTLFIYLKTFGVFQYLVDFIEFLLFISLYYVFLFVLKKIIEHDKN